MPPEIKEQAIYFQAWFSTAQIIMTAVTATIVGSSMCALLFYRVRQIERILSNGLSSTVNSMRIDVSVMRTKLEMLEENCVVHRQNQAAQTQVNVSPGNH